MAGISFEEASGSTTPKTSSKGLSFEEASVRTLAPETKEVGGRWHNIARTSLESAPAAAAGIAGFGAGMEAVAPVAAVAAPLTGPAAPITAGAIELAGGLGGAFLASGAAQKVTNWMHEAFAPEDYKQRQIEKAQRPYGTFAAETLTNLAGMSPKTAPEVAGKLLTKPIAQRAVGATLQTGIEAGSEYAQEGKVDPVKLAVAAGTGAAMPGFNIAGEKVFKAGQAVGKAVVPKGTATPTVTTLAPDLPPKPTETSTPEERAAYINKLKEIKAQRDAKTPLVEAALRNKETGEIERMGPKHDEQRKLDTADTHEQGFLDEKGRFLTRQEAADRAVATGQIESEKYTTKEVSEPGKTVESISKDLEVLRERLASAEQTDAHDTAQKTRKEIKALEQKLEIVKQYGPTEPKYRDVTKTRPKLERPEEGLHSGDLRNAGDERFKITEEQPAGTAKPPVEEQKPFDPTERVTRQDFKSAIEDNHNKLIDLEIQAEEALARGDEGMAQSHNEEISRLEAEQEQLHKDMPAVQFKDIANPTWEEWHDHLWGAKTVGEALDRIVNTKGLGSVGQRLLTKALNKSGYLRDAKLELNNEFLKYTDQKTGEERDAAGLYQPDSHTVQLGATGNVRVFLHEAVHAGTVRLLNDPASVAGKQMNELYEKYKELQQTKYEEALAKFKEENVAPTIGELREFEKVHGDHYGHSDVYEFVAEAFTSKEFQTLLSKLDVRETPKGKLESIWDSFKEVVRLGLNVPENARTALDDVIESGAKLVEEAATLKHEGTAGDVYASKVDTTEDRTKTSPRDVKSEEEFYDIATDIYEKTGEDAALKFYEGYKEYKKTWLEPVKETEKFVGTNLKNKLAAERVISNNTHDLKQKAEAGDVNLEELTYKIDKGEVLDSKEVSVAAKFRGLMDELGKRAMEVGVIKGWHENYVARNVVAEGAAPPTALQEFMREMFGTGDAGGMGGTKTTTKYGKERRLKTREDLNDHINRMNQWLEENGKDYRFKLKTDNLAEIYHDYAQAVEKAIENKNLIDNLKQIRNVEGESLIRPITPENPLPHGWEVMEGSELAGYAVHPDLKPALKFVFDAGPGELMKAFGNISQVTKRLNVIGSFFHAKSLMEVMSSAQIPIWTPLKEAVVLPLVEKGIKATTGKDIQLSAISKATEQFRNGGVGDNVDKWIKDGGLQLEMPEDVSKGILSASGKFADQMIGKYGPKTRILESALSTVEKYTLGMFDKYTWDYLHTGGKLMVADAYLDKARIQAAKEGKPFDETAARQEISRFVNDSFGGLNWFDAATQARTELGKRISMAAYSPEGRRSLQIALFAPDWTISTLRAFSSALPKELNPTKWHPVEGVKGMMTPTTKADYARLYQFKTALTYLTLINAINLMTADRPVWDNKDPTRIEWPDGTSMQAMKHAMEPYHWLADPDKTLSNKLGFIPKAIIVGIAGTEYASPNAPKLVDRSATGRLKAVASMAEPFQIQAAATAPEGEGVKRAALGTLGLPVYGATAKQRKEQRAAREKALKQQAREYHEKERKAGRE